MSQRSIYFYRPYRSVYRYLTDKAARFINYYLLVSHGFIQIYWCADAWGAEIREKNKQAKDMVSDLLSECEMRMVNKVENVLEDRESRVG